MSGTTGADSGNTQGNDARHPLSLTAHELMDKFGSGELAPDDRARDQLDFAREMDKILRAFYEIAPSPTNQKEADEPGSGMGDKSPSSHSRAGFDGQIDERMTVGREILKNIPVSFKDIFTVKGFHATAGSKILSGYRPPYDATVAARTRAAGNFIVGKTSLDEFAMGSSNETSAYGPCFNPWDIGRVPGGSSGGGAVSVAACQSVVGWGTDTGGSVRLPASFCGIAGYKPSYGLLSRFGLIAYVSSMDSPSIFARDTLDIALAMNTVCYGDSYDATVNVPEPVPDFVRESDPNQIGKPRLAVIKELTSEKILDPRVAGRFYSVVDSLRKAGAIIEETSFPLWELALPAYYIITTAECSSNLARFDGVRYGPGGHTESALLDMYFARRGGPDGFGPETKRRILLGTYVLSAGYFDAYYNKARALRKMVESGIAELMKKYDGLIFPTAPDPAFKLGERMDDPVKMYMSDIATVAANLAGVCAISLPCGTVESADSSLTDDAKSAGITREMVDECCDDDGEIRLPVGLQIMGARYGDAKLLALARWFERVTGLGYEIPPLIKRKLSAWH